MIFTEHRFFLVLHEQIPFTNDELSTLYLKGSWVSSKLDPIKKEKFKMIEIWGFDGKMYVVIA